jgi:hypothetical protein
MSDNRINRGVTINEMFMEFPSDEPERDYAVEARMILKGLTGVIVEKRHLEALEELYECKLIKLANDLDALKHKALE